VVAHAVHQQTRRMPAELREVSNASTTLPG
jgi:hypothetical protein